MAKKSMIQLITLFIVFLLSQYCCLFSSQEISDVSYQDCEELFQNLHDVESVNVLLQNLGFNPNRKIKSIADYVDKDGNTIFHHACHLGHKEFVYKVRTDPYFRFVRNNKGMTPSFFIDGVGFVDWCVTCQNDLKVQNTDGHILLIWHIIQNNVDIVEALLKNMESCFPKNYLLIAGIKPFSYATSLDMIEILSKSGMCQMTVLPHEIVSIDSETPKDQSTRDVNMSQALAKYEAEEHFWSCINTQPNINIKNKYNETLLHCAISKNKFKIIEQLVSRGIDILVQDSQGNTALHLAAIQNNVSLVHYLLQHASNLLEIKNKEGQTALMVCVIENKNEMSDFLLSQGADIFTKNRYGHGLLHFVKDVQLAEILIQKGLSVHDVGMYNHTPLHFATTPEIAELLISYGADIHATSIDDRTPLHEAKNTPVAATLIKAFADINAIDAQGCTPLYYAVIAYNIKRCHLLLDNNANIIVIKDKTILDIVKANFSPKCLYLQEAFKDFCKQRNLFQYDYNISGAYINTLPEEDERDYLRILHFITQHPNKLIPDRVITKFKKLHREFGKIPLMHPFNTAQLTMTGEQVQRLNELHNLLMCQSEKVTEDVVQQDLEPSVGLIFSVVLDPIEYSDQPEEESWEMLSDGNDAQIEFEGDLSMQDQQDMIISDSPTSVVF